jgi:hypothetical protein
MLEDKDRYAAVVQLIVVTENTSWNRFYNFLVFASVLVLAWTAIYTQANPPGFATAIKVLLSVVGFLSGLAWAGLGWRGRELLKKFVDLGKQLEEKGEAADAGHKVSPCKTAAEQRDNMMFWMVGSYYLLIGVPLLCSILFAVLFFATVC